MPVLLIQILAVTGKVLLGILIAGLVLLALALFFPVCYRVDIDKTADDIRVRACLYWLFHFIHGSFRLDKTESGMTHALGLRILGIPLPLERLLKKKPKKKKKGDEGRVIRTEAPKKPTVRPGERKHPETRIEPEVVPGRHPGPILRLSARINAFRGKCRRIWHSLNKKRSTLEEWIEYLTSDEFRTVLEVIRKDGIPLVKHLMPRTIRGTVRFGAEDPATTGMVYGGASAILPLIPAYPKDLVLIPCFTESCLDADVTARGRFFLIVIIVHAVKIIIKKEIRALIGRIRGMTKKNKNKKSGHKGKVRGKSWRKTEKTMHFKTT